MRIVDFHCDTMMKLWETPEKSILDGDYSINLKLLQEHDSLLQCFALYLDRDALEKLGTTDYYVELLQMYDAYKGMLEQYPDIIRPVLQYSDIAKNMEAGKISSLLTVEEGGFLDDHPERLQEVYDMGVRLITLTWNHENSLGHPNNDDPTLHNMGLKKYGIETVERMNDLGMVIDCSHLSEGGFYDVAKYSKKPFVASHSCARAICNHRRNLTNDQLRILGEKGGFVGVNFYCGFLKEGSVEPKIDWAITHLKYMINKAGLESVGFGSDFDGISKNGEFVNYSGFTELLNRMEKYFTDDEIDRISHENALRLLRDTIK